MGENPLEPPPGWNEESVRPSPSWFGRLFFSALLISIGGVLALLAAVFLAEVISADFVLSERIRLNMQPSALDGPGTWEMNLSRVRWAEAGGSGFLLASLGIMGSGVWLLVKPRQPDYV